MNTYKGPRFELIAGSEMNPSELKKRLINLEHLLISHLPRSVHMLTICRIALLQKFPKHCKYEFHQYLEGDEINNEEEPLIICVQGPNLHTKKGVIIMSPLTINLKMVSAFDAFIGWDAPMVFHSVPEPFWKVVRTLCRSHNNSKDSNGFECKFYSLLDIDKAKKIELPVEWLSENKFKVRSLEEQDAYEVVSNWHFGDEHSEQEVKNQSKLLPSCGLFTEEGELASSVLQSTIGLFNVLYTPEKFRRRGFGHIVMSYVSREAANKLGTNPLGESEVWNKASFKLMEKLGYEQIYYSLWLYYSPPVPVSA